MNVATSGLLAVAALLYAAVFWGFVWFPVRLLEQAGMGGLWQVLVSYLSATLLLGLVRGWRLPGATRYAHEVGWLMLAAGWTNVAFVLAVIGDEVVRVVILFYLSPLWAVLLGRWLLGEAIRPITGAMVLLGLGGALVMLWQPRMLSQAPGDGDLLALTSGFAFALTNVMTRRLQGLGTVVKTQLTWIGVVVVSALLLLGLGTPPPTVGPPVWGGAVLLGLAGFMFSTLCTVYAVSRMPVQRSSVIMLFEVVVGALSAWWLAGEAVDGREWLGGAMIIGAGLIAVFAGREKQIHA